MTSPTTRTRALANVSLEMLMLSLPRSQFFHPPGRVTVPGLATRTLPEMLLCFESAGGAAVSQQRFDRMVQRSLHLRMKLLMLELFTCDPFRCSYQRGFMLKVVHIPVACRWRRC